MSETPTKKQRFSWRFRMFLLWVVVVVIWFSFRTGLFPKKIRRVILISIDTCRADYLSCYGYAGQTTPNIDALAREGILFEKVVAPVPLTLPSHCSMLTGTIPPFHGVHHNSGYQLGASNITLAEILKDRGYKTGAVISTVILYSEFGLDQGFDYYIKEEIGPDGRRAEEANFYAFKWLQKHKSEDFFLFLHYFDPHLPYDPPQFFASAFPDNPYAGEIAYTDKCIGRLIKKLKDLDLYDSSLIIITSDHGEMLGEHGETEHGYFIYESAIKVPLIIKVPKGPQGKRIDTPVAGLIDIVPTICNFLAIPVPSHVQGKDLSAYFSGKGGSKKPRYIYCESMNPTKYGGNSLLGVVTDRWKYIQTTRPELYDLDEDRHEANNLVYEQPKRARLMQQNLKLILNEQSYKDRNDSSLALNPESRKRLESLGYVAAGGVREVFKFDQNKADPKDLLRLHEQNKQLTTFRLSKQLEQAKSLGEKMLAENPQSLNIRETLAQIAFNSGDIEGAIEHYSKVLAQAEKIQQTVALGEKIVYGAHDKIARAFLRLNKFDKARMHITAALQIKPNQPHLHYTLGRAFAGLGESDKAIKHYKTALQLNPNNLIAVGCHENLAKIFLEQKKFDQAVEHYTETLKLAPDHPVIHNNLGITLSGQGKLDKAIEHWNKSLHINPEQAQVHNWLGNTLALQYQIDEAVNHWTKSLKIDPAQPDLHARLANALYQQGKRDGPVKHWTEALRLQPDQPEILNNLAWFKSAYKNEDFHDPNEAIRFGLRACQLTEYKEPGVLDTLSVAYAAAGKFAEAAETAEKAIDLAQSTNQQQLADEIKGHLELYKRGLPYYDSAQSH